MSVYMCVHITAHANKKWVSGLRCWSYKAIVSHLTWVLGTEFSSSASIVHAFNHWVTFSSSLPFKEFLFTTTIIINILIIVYICMHVSYLCYTTQTYLPKKLLLTIDRALLHQFTTKKMPPKTCPQVNLTNAVP